MMDSKNGSKALAKCLKFKCFELVGVPQMQTYLEVRMTRKHALCILEVRFTTFGTHVDVHAHAHANAHATCTCHMYMSMHMYGTWTEV